MNRQVFVFDPPGYYFGGQNYELDLTQAKFSDLRGFEEGVLKVAESFVGEMLKNITRSVDWIFIYCDLITRRANDVAIDVLYCLSTSDLRVSFPFLKEPKRLEFHPVTEGEIKSVNIRITDGRNNILNLNNIDKALTIIIKQDPKHAVEALILLHRYSFKEQAFAPDTNSNKHGTSERQ